MTKLQMFQLLLLFSLFTIVYANERCLAISQEDSQRTFHFPIAQQDISYPTKWILRDSSVDRIVSTCWSSTCDDVKGFYANITRVVNGGDISYTAILSIGNMKTTMTYIRFDYGRYPKGGCSLLNYALPAKPVCYEPTVNGGEIVMICSTKRVYPEGNCSFIYQAVQQDIKFTVTHSHTKLSNGYITYCTFRGIWKPSRYVNRALNMDGTRLAYRFKVLMSPTLPLDYTGNVSVSSSWSKTVKIQPESLSWNARGKGAAILSDERLMNLTFYIKGNPAPWKFTLQKTVDQRNWLTLSRVNYQVIVNASNSSSDGGRVHVVSLLSQAPNRLSPGKYRFILDNGVGNSNLALSFPLYFDPKQDIQDSGTTGRSLDSTTFRSGEDTGGDKRRDRGGDKVEEEVGEEGEEEGKSLRDRLVTVVVPAIVVAVAVLGSILIVIIVLWRKKKMRRERRRSRSSRRSLASRRGTGQLSRIHDVGHVAYTSGSSMGISAISQGAINPQMLNMSPPPYEDLLPEDLPPYEEPPPSYDYVQQMKQEGALYTDF